MLNLQVKLNQQKQLKLKRIPSGSRYGLQSAIVTTSSALPNSMGTTVTTLYFDDYGKKEYTETVSNITAMGQNISTTKASIIMDNSLYTWEVGKKQGSKIKLDTKFDPAKIDYEDD